MPRTIEITAPEGYPLTLRLVKVRAQYYALVHARTGQRLGHIYRRDSWRLRDWYAELAVGQRFINCSEETLADCFGALPRRWLTRCHDARKQKGIADEMVRSAERLQRDIAEGGRLNAPRP